MGPSSILTRADPPAYYLFEGLVGRLVSPGANAVRLMRLASVALVAALVASAAASFARVRRPWPAMAGLLVALTPMVFHIGSSVNPNGVEMGAAIALWASAAVLISEAATRIDRRLVLRVARRRARVGSLASGVALDPAAHLPRIAVPRRQPTVRALVRSRDVQLTTAAVAVAALFQIGWDAVVQSRYFGNPVPSTMTTSEILQFTVGKGRPCSNR